MSKGPEVLEVETQEALDELIKGSGVVVLDVYTGWCGPCSCIEPHFSSMNMDTEIDALAATGGGLQFARACADNIESLESYRAQACPRFLIFGGVNASKGTPRADIQAPDTPKITEQVLAALEETTAILTAPE